ncbi:MAG: nucleotide exchange factor GrpE [Bacteroidales bacterium]|nr:nucleotide exchange factor GrpE [Candidatus Latescibacterota bacterium]
MSETPRIKKGPEREYVLDEDPEIGEETNKGNRYTDCETQPENEAGDMKEKSVEDTDKKEVDTEKKAKSKKRLKKHGTKNLADLLSRKNNILQAMEKQMEKVEQDLNLKEDKMLRMAAEFENYKKRTRREWELHQKRANADLLTDILGVLDDFGRAFESAEDTEDRFFSGIRMIHNQLLDVLAKAGLTEIDAEHKEFDPQFHEAMGESESDEIEPGKVLYIVQNGYLLNDQLLRPARVIVVKEKNGPQSAPDASENLE